MRNAATVTHDHEARENLTTAAAARALGLAEGTVRLLERRGELPAMRLSSGMRVFKAADVERVRLARAARR